MRNRKEKDEFTPIRILRQFSGGELNRAEDERLMGGKIGGTASNGKSPFSVRDSDLLRSNRIL